MTITEGDVTEKV